MMPRRASSSRDHLGRDGAVFLVCDMFEPVDGLSAEPLLDGDVRHRGRWAGAVPMYLARREPDDITRPDCLNRPAFTLDEAGAGRHDQGLPERVGVPRGAHLVRR